MKKTFGIGICPRCKRKEKIRYSCYINMTRCEKCFEKDLKKIDESDKN